MSVEYNQRVASGRDGVSTVRCRAQMRWAETGAVHARRLQIRQRGRERRATEQAEEGEEGDGCCRAGIEERKVTVVTELA